MAERKMEEIGNRDARNKELQIANEKFQMCNLQSPPAACLFARLSAR